MILLEHHSVVVENQDQMVLRWKWNGHEYTIAPGTRSTIPFPLLCKELGDPRSGHQEQVVKLEGGQLLRIPSREWERKRLDNLYGVSARKVDAQMKGQEPPQISVADVAPKVKSFTTDNEPIQTVVDDWDGQNQLILPMDLDSPDALRAQLAQIQRDHENLKRLLEAKLANPDTDETVPEDSPGKPVTVPQTMEPPVDSPGISLEV